MNSKFKDVRIMKEIIVLIIVVLNLLITNQVKSQTNNYIIIKEKAGVTTVNYPIQIARPFVEGEITDYPQAVISGVPVLTQADVKTRWEDNSAKHSVISFYIPELEANDSIIITFINQSESNQNNYLTKAQMLDTAEYNFDAFISLVTMEDSVHISAREILTNDDFEYWLKGANVSSIILADHTISRKYDFGFTPDGFADTVYKSLRPIFHATFFPLTEQIRIRYICELANTELLQSQSYGIKLYSGIDNQLRYTRNEFNQHPMSRWTKEFWIGGTPSKIEIDHNLEYLIKTGMIPNYDLTKEIPENILENEYINFLTSQRDVFQSGNLTKSMGTTGGRPDIGPYPSWVVRWLYTGDWRMKEQSFVNADLSSAWPVHLREADTSSARVYLQNSSIQAYGKPVSACSRPFLWFDIGRFDWQYTPVDQRVKFVNGWETNSGDWNAFNNWVPDNAHQPDLVSVLYMLSGDFWYLEELMFIASYGTVNSNGSYTTSHLGRGPTGAEGNLGDQIRGNAWNLRTRARAAVLIPDTLIEKTYFTQKVNEQIEIWEGSKEITGTVNYNTTNYLWGKNVHNPSVNNNYGNSPLYIWEVGTTYHVQYEINADSTLFAISPWEMNFLIFTLGHVEELGFESSSLRQYLGQYLVGLMTDSGSTPFNVALSRLPVIHKLSGQYFNSWESVCNAIDYSFYPNGIETEFHNLLQDVEHGYSNIAMCATSFVTDLPNGNMAWHFMDSVAINNPLLNNNPKWAILPRDSSAYCLTVFNNQSYSICDGDSVFINNTWYKTEGVYLDSLLSTAGCDSIIVINVSFNPIYEVHNDIEICYGDSALINNFWYHADGYYTFVLPTVQGCDSVVVTHLIVNPLPQTPIATQANNIIYSSSPTGNQWYSSQGLIIGAVNQVYIPNCSDTYYVIVTDSNGCSSNASNEIQFVFTSISDFSNKRLSIYPNPAKQILNITSENENIKTVKIFNIYGQELMCVNQEFDNGINVEILSNGIYVLEIETDDQVWTYKFIKQ